MFGSDTVIVEEVRDEKAEKMIEYIRSLKAIEDAIEPYAEQKRELKKDFKAQGWLTKEEIRDAIRAYRMISKDEDFDQLHVIYDKIMKSFRGAK